MSYPDGPLGSMTMVWVCKKRACSVPRVCPVEELLALAVHKGSPTKFRQQRRPTAERVSTTDLWCVVHHMLWSDLKLLVGWQRAGWQKWVSGRGKHAQVSA